MRQLPLRFTSILLIACLCTILQGCSVVFRLFMVNKTNEPVPVTITFRHYGRLNFWGEDNRQVKYIKGTPKVKGSLEKRLNDSIPVTLINDTTAQIMLPATSTTLIQKYLNGSPVGTVTIGSGSKAKHYTFDEFYRQTKRNGLMTMPVNLRYEIPPAP